MVQLPQAREGKGYSLWPPPCWPGPGCAVNTPHCLKVSDLTFKGKCLSDKVGLVSLKTALFGLPV